MLQLKLVQTIAEQERIEDGDNKDTGKKQLAYSYSTKVVLDLLVEP